MNRMQTNKPEMTKMYIMQQIINNHSTLFAMAKLMKEQNRLERLHNVYGGKNL